MRTLGDTLKGPDPLPQQLEELDAQSRLMLGFKQYRNGPPVAAKKKNT